MRRGRSLAALALSGAALGATAAQAPPFTLPATQSCLTALPNAVRGLPPASPPTPPALFVDALAGDAVSTWGLDDKPRRSHRQLGAWYGAAQGYQGIILTFFATVPDARSSLRAVAGQSGGRRIRNVVVTWDRQSKPSVRVRALVLGCLRTTVADRGARRTPAATLATSAGAWRGHTRRLTIAPDGAATESTDDGCCVRVYDLTFRIVSVRGTLTHASATYRVTSFVRHTRDVPLSRVGDVGTLVLRNGIVTDTRTRVFFCSDPAWGATGACGA